MLSSTVPKMDALGLTCADNWAIFLALLPAFLWLASVRVNDSYPQP